MPYDAPIEELIRLANSSEPDHWAAYPALAHSALAAAGQVLADGLASSDWQRRRISLEWIGSCAGASAFEEKILRAFCDPSPWVIRQACKTVAQLKLVSGRPYLLNLLADPSPEIRAEAVRALRDIPDENVVEAAVSLFEKDRDEGVQREAGWTLREIVSARSWERIFSLFEKDALVRHRAWACEIAAQFDMAGKSELSLKSLLDDADGHVRAAAQKALDAHHNL